jgi:hypothetical protein
MEHDMKSMESLKKMLRLIFFRIDKSDFLNFNGRDLQIGLLVTWIAGMGRYWDDPNASALQHIGVGSFLYVFALALFIWVLLLPWKIENWNYWNLLTFISFTSLPAILYATPVEKFFDIPTSSTINAYFLLIVALWRVALLAFYLVRLARLSIFQTVIATFLPLTVIVTSLTFLNLSRGVIQIMGGFREPTSNDSVYLILTYLTVLSFYIVIPFFGCYLFIAYRKYKEIAQRPLSTITSE